MSRASRARFGCSLWSSGTAAGCGAGLFLEHFDLNLKHPTLPEIIYFNVLGDESCFKLKSKRYSQNLQSVMRCHIAAFEAMGGSPEHILYDRMKTAVIGEDEAGIVTYNTSLVALLNHYGTVPRACRPYRAKTKGKVERPFRYIRQDFFLARPFRNIDDLNAQFDLWRTGIANPRTHATTLRVVDEAFAEELPSLKPLPAIPYNAVLTVERRVSHEGMVSVAGNYYSVPPSRDLALQDPAGHWIQRGNVFSKSKTTPMRSGSLRMGFWLLAIRS